MKLVHRFGWLVIGLVLGIGATFAVQSVGAQTQSQVAKFRIVVEPSVRSLKATCELGCAWKTVSYSCDAEGRQAQPQAQGQPCKASIDQEGVGGIK